MGTQDRGQPIHKTCSIILSLLPLSTVSQGGDRAFSWSDLPLVSVLTHAKVKMKDTGQALHNNMTFIQTNILVSILLHKTSSSYPTFTISCPCHLVDVSSPYPTIWVLARSSYIWMVLSSCFLWKSWKEEIVQAEKFQLVLQKGLYSVVHANVLSPILHA
jgi:hypothetical protein